MSKISSVTIARLCELSSEDVAEKLGIEVCRHRALCFMHEDHHPSLYFYGSNRERWHCFACNKSGGPISLVVENFGCNFIDACIWLCQKYNITTEYYTSNTISVRQLPQKQKRLSGAESFSREVAQWILDSSSLTSIGQEFLFAQRYLDVKLIQKLNIVSIDDQISLVERLCEKFDSKVLAESGFVTVTNGRIYLRTFTPCVLFPYYDQQWNLIGIQSRYLGANKNAPRFQFISSQKARLFNLPILETMKPGEDLYIAEGVTDCLALLSAGRKAVAIPSATILPQYDMFDLKKYNLHMYPDKDDAGRRAYFNLRNYFINLFTSLKEEHLPANVKDYGEYYIKMKHE